MAALEMIGSHLKQLRKAKGLTLAEVAEEAGLSQPYLSQVETGARTASSDALAKLAAVYGVPPEQLLEQAGKWPKSGGQRKGRKALTIHDLTPGEHEELIAYLAYYRERQAKKRKR